MYLLQVVLAASVSGYSSVNIDDISMSEDCHKTGNYFSCNFEYQFEFILG